MKALFKFIQLTRSFDESLVELLFKQVWFTVTKWQEYSGGLTETREIAYSPEKANVVSSISRSPGESLGMEPNPDWHRPVLDIDMPIAVVPSSTPGHYHLFIDKEMSWNDYSRLLGVLAEVGILEPGYVGASLARKATMVRLPWVKK